MRAAGASAAAIRKYRTVWLSTYVIAQKTAAMPQAAFASVKKSAR
jgi:hypothetical protein